MKGRRLILSVALLLLCASGLWADSITFNLDTPLPGEPSLPGPTPWLSATINVSGETATLTMMTSGLTGNAYDLAWWFHFNNPQDAQNTALPSIKYSDGVAALIVTYSQDNLGPNSSASGGGFDLEFRFPTANSNDQRFVSGLTSVYIITAEGLELDWFTDGISNPFYYSAAHVASIGAMGYSSKIGALIAAVPEPGTILLFGFGLTAFACIGRRLH